MSWPEALVVCMAIAAPAIVVTVVIYGTFKWMD